MSNTKIIIAVIVVILLVIGGYFAFSHTAAAPTPDMASTTQDLGVATTTTDSVATSTGATVSPDTTVITYTNAGFSPKNVSIKVGDTVRFVNNSSHGMWVASGEHPTHTDYDGTDTHEHCTNGADNNGGFDECTAVNPGSVYSFTFPKAGTFEFHNHVQASDTGTVTVK